MKTLTSLAMGAAGLALATSTHGQTVLRLTGSTAFRSVTHNAIRNILNGPGGVGQETFAFSGATLGSANFANFRGRVGTEEVLVKCAWGGAVGGTRNLTQNIAIPYLADSVVGSVAGDANTPNGATPEVADGAMADQFQGSTAFTSPVLVYTAVGVVGYQWVASTGAPAGLTNMTPLLAQALAGGGELPLALWTGLAADEGTKIYFTGRSPDSGTRLITFAESGIGVFSNVLQWQPAFSSTYVVSGQAYFPAEVVNGANFATGNSGYSSGGSLVTAVRANPAAINGFYVAYMGSPDAANAIAAASGTNGNPARALTWNGVPYSVDNVRNGSYTFWGYEHLAYRSSLAGVKKTVADTLANQILTVDAPVLLSSMRVSRQGDGTLVGPDY